MRIFTLVIGVFVFCGAAVAVAPVPSNLAAALLKEAGGLKPQVLQYAMKASSCAARSGVVHDKNILTVIDYSLPSTQKRLWTFDLQKQRLLYREWVAHGMNTGNNLALKFSNAKDSNMTSLGVYVTDKPYIGRNGYSLRLIGLEKGFNDNVYDRAVVFHGAWYVSDQMIQRWGRLGRSFGCPAVRREIATPMIDTIKEGSLLFAYYPDKTWLKNSHFINGC
jgi:hypothetical protein